MKVQHEKVSYLDVLNADVVIVSVQFILTNKYFLNMPAGHDAAPYLYCCVWEVTHYTTEKYNILVVKYFL